MHPLPGSAGMLHKHRRRRDSIEDRSTRGSKRGEIERIERQRKEVSYGDAVRVLLTDTLGLSLALLEGVLVLELGSHNGGVGAGVELGERRLVGGTFICLVGFA